MKGNSIRLQYSGFVIFVAKMLSVATGLAFQYIIARCTSPEEYGVWFNINDVVAYFVILSGIIPFWVMRFVARSEKGAVKTGVIANLAISLAATVIYLPLVPLMVSALGVRQYASLYILVAFQIVELHMLNIFEACLRAKKPQTLGYGLLIAELFKVSLGYILIMRLNQPLVGAIISLTTGIAVQLLYYLKLLAKDLTEKIEWAYVKEWLKGSVANVYNVVGNQIASFILILLFTFGGRDARSYYGASSLIANIIMYSTVLAFALYPKLLAEGKIEDVTTSIKTVLTFAIPMTAGTLVAPDLYLSILERGYADAWCVLVVLAIDAFVATVSTIFSSILYGFERVDEEARISFRKLFRSRMFFSFSLPYIHSAITIPLTLFVLSNLTHGRPIPSAFSVAIINSAARLAMFLLLYVMVRGIVKVVIPWKNIAKYVFASAVMAGFLYCLRIFLRPSRVFQILGITGFAGVFYLTLLIIIDKDTRMLAKLAWQEIKGRFG